MSRVHALVAIAALGAIGMVPAAPRATARPPAPLAPACKSWILNSPVLTIRQSGGPLVEVDWWSGHGTTGTGQTNWLVEKNGDIGIKQAGQAQGGTTGSRVDFTIKWAQGVSGHYTGEIDNDTGRVLGGRTSGGGAEETWQADETFTCAAREAEAPKQAPPPPPAEEKPSPVEQPKQGPTVTFNPVVGGLVAHVTDRSGVTSQCTYSSDFVTRTFTLTANGSFDVRIVPALPGFRNWEVRVTCDNGTSTTTTTFF